MVSVHLKAMLLLLLLVLGVACAKPNAPAQPPASVDSEPSATPAASGPPAVLLSSAFSSKLSAHCPELTFELEGKALYLRKCALSAAAVDALLSIPELNQLRLLTLFDAPVDVADLKRLVEAPALAGLERFYVHEASLDEAVFKALSGDKALPGLKFLSLQGRAVGARVTLDSAALGALLGRPKGQLDALQLSVVDLKRPLDAAALGKAALRPKVVSLSAMSLYDETLKAFAATGLFERADDVELAGSMLTDAGVSALLQDRALAERLIRLDLTGAEVTDASLKVLWGLPQLESLGLYNTKVTGDVFATLPKQTKLKKLELGMCPLSDKALEAIRTLEGVDVNTAE